MEFKITTEILDLLKERVELSEIAKRYGITEIELCNELGRTYGLIGKALEKKLI